MPKVKDCIAYIVGCGFTFDGKISRRRYLFTKNSGTIPNGSKEILFTLTELRHAKQFGW